MKIVIGNRSCLVDVHCPIGTRVQYRFDNRIHEGVITKEYPYLFEMTEDNGTVWHIAKGYYVCHELRAISPKK